MRNFSKRFSLGRDRSDESKVEQKVILSLDNKKFCLFFRVKLTVVFAAAELRVAEWNIHTEHLGFSELLPKSWCTTGPYTDLFFALWLWSRPLLGKCSFAVLGSADTIVRHVLPGVRRVQKEKAMMHLHCGVYAEFWIAIARLLWVSKFMWNQANHFYPPL